MIETDLYFVNVLVSKVARGSVVELFEVSLAKISNFKIGDRNNLACPLSPGVEFGKLKNSA